MAAISKVRITSVKAQETAPGTGTPFTLSYDIEVKLADGTVKSTTVTRNTDGAIWDDTAFGTWWDDYVNTILEGLGDTPPVWADVKVMLPSAW